MRKKKAQAAMEFLMTYGWAILVVLVVIAALAYFGVLNPQQFLPKKCQFAQGLVCTDHKIVIDQTSVIRINNGLGSDIRVTDVVFLSDNGRVACSLNASEVKILTAGDEYTFEWWCYNGVGALPPAGEHIGISTMDGARIKGGMFLSYSDLQTGFDHEITGTLITDVE